MLEAGCGEGYGADLIAYVARQVIAVDYDDCGGPCPEPLSPSGGDASKFLAELPAVRTRRVDVVVNFQSSSICGIVPIQPARPGTAGPDC